MKSLTKRIPLIIIALALISFAAWLILQPPTVECMVLEYSELQNTFTEMGEAVPLAEADIYSRSGGKLVEVKALEGSLVAAGEVLFVFEQSELENEQKSLLAQMAVLDSQIAGQLTNLHTQKSSLQAERANIQIMIEQAQIEENQLKDGLDKLKQLYESGGAPTQDLLAAQAAYDLAAKNEELLNNQLRQAVNQLTVVDTEINDFYLEQEPAQQTKASQRQQLLAQKQALKIQLDLLAGKLAETEIRAPQDGIIRDCSLKIGQMLPNGGKLCSIYQPGLYKIECYILVENITGLHINDQVNITLRQRDGDIKYLGQIAQIAQDAADRVSKVGLSEKRIKVEIDLAEGEWAGLGPYWPVEVNFITAKANNCLLAPKTALFEEADSVWKIWAVREGKARALTVERGVQTPSLVEVSGELQPLELIVKNAKTSKIIENASVKVVINE